MKAKDWARRFQTEPLNQVLQDLVNETIQLAHQRGFSPNAIASATQEQLQKWTAIQKLVPELHESFILDEALQHHDPAFYETFLKIAHEDWKTRKRKSIQRAYKQEWNNAKNETDPQLRLGKMIAVITCKSLDLDELNYS